jgi:hypothetical protein
MDYVSETFMIYSFKAGDHISSGLRPYPSRPTAAASRIQSICVRCSWPFYPYQLPWWLAYLLMIIFWYMDAITPLAAYT